MPRTRTGCVRSRSRRIRTTRFARRTSIRAGCGCPSRWRCRSTSRTSRRWASKLDAKVLADPLDAPLAAVVWLGGCTASFVSPDGLIVTNHHCVQGALQLNSTPGQQPASRTASSRRRRPTSCQAGPAQRVMVVQSYKDVTKDDARRPRGDQGSGRAQGGVREAREAADRGMREGSSRERAARSRASSAAAMYQLIEMLEIRDVRLVYVPARSVGDYGGEIDNWEWPRHTGDWSFYPRVRRQGWPAGRLLEGQRPVPPDALAQGLDRGAQAQRLRDGRRLPGPDRASTPPPRSTTTSSSSTRT